MNNSSESKANTAALFKLLFHYLTGQCLNSAALAPLTVKISFLPPKFPDTLAKNIGKATPKNKDLTNFIFDKSQCLLAACDINCKRLDLNRVNSSMNCD